MHTEHQELAVRIEAAQKAAGALAKRGCAVAPIYEHLAEAARLTRARLAEYRATQKVKAPAPTPAAD